MLDQLTIFKMARARMDWAAQRQEVLAENVANANTPRYLPKDVRKFDFKDMLAEVQAPPLATTHPQHIAAPASNPLAVETTRKPFESTPNGNGVILEEQMAKINDTKGAHNMAADIYQKNLKMMRLALGRTGA